MKNVKPQVIIWVGIKPPIFLGIQIINLYARVLKILETVVANDEKYER